MDRLQDVFKGEPRWHWRQIEEVLCDDDLGYGNFPAHRDIKTVGDLLRIGEAGMTIRFREIDPAIWAWLFEQMGVKS